MSKKREELAAIQQRIENLKRQHKLLDEAISRDELIQNRKLCSAIGAAFLERIKTAGVARLLHEVAKDLSPRYAAGLRAKLKATAEDPNATDQNELQLESPEVTPRR